MTELRPRVIEVHGLCRAFGVFRAVDDIAFHVDKGEIFGFLGANGAGKTTTIRMLSGLLRPTAGHGHVLGFDVRKQIEKVKPKVGYMSQKFSLYPDLNVEENLDFYGGLYGLGGARLAARKEWAIGMAGLVERRRSVTATLPLGFKQRLALGAALLHQPELLFLDEPTAGVAPEARREFWDLIHELAEQGTTIFVTSHYMDEVEHCDRIALMSRGKIAALDTPANLKATAVPGSIVLLETRSHFDAVAAALQDEPAVLSIQPFGADFHVIVARTQDAAALITRRAASAALVDAHARVVEPSLEDVFISVISQVER